MNSSLCMTLSKTFMLRTSAFITALSALLWPQCDCFLFPKPALLHARETLASDIPIGTAHRHSTTSLFVAPRRKLSPSQVSRRKELLTRSGPYFYLNRFQGSVEFGSTAKLVTKLDSEANPESIAKWLSDGRGLALSIWDENMMKDLGDSIYRLQTMKLQFVTIQCSPSVDVQMWTQPDPKTGEPVFLLQSIDFDPNIQLLPGVAISASSLGIQIEVVGQLRPSKDGTGVTGLISFATTGTLPPPLRILPESPLKMASDSINDTVVTFAVDSFRKGAVRKYKEFREAQAEKLEKQEA